jgi:hypothetical protein
VSYDLLVFHPGAAPKEREAFLCWWKEQAKWPEGHGYDDPAVSTPALRAWFLEAIATFPAMNGPYARPDDARPEETQASEADYSVGTNVIYTAFAWSKAEQARELTFALAAKHGLGFFDASSALSGVWLPDGAGALVLQHVDADRAREEERLLALTAWVESGTETRRHHEPVLPGGASEATRTLRASLVRNGKPTGLAPAAMASSFRLALGRALSAALPSTPADARRAVLLSHDRTGETYLSMVLADDWVLRYPTPAPTRTGTGSVRLLSALGQTYLETGLDQVTAWLSRAGRGDAPRFAEVLLAASATAVLGREADFYKGQLVLFQTVTDAAVPGPTELSLKEALAIDPAVQPGQELGFQSDWSDWLFPLLDWLHAEPRH